MNKPLLTPQQREAGVAWVAMLGELERITERQTATVEQSISIGFMFGMALALKHPEYAAAFHERMDSITPDGGNEEPYNFADRFVKRYPITAEGVGV